MSRLESCFQSCSSPLPIIHWGVSEWQGWTKWILGWNWLRLSSIQYSKSFQRRKQKREVVEKWSELIRKPTLHDKSVASVSARFECRLSWIFTKWSSSDFSTIDFVCVLVELTTFVLPATCVKLCPFHFFCPFHLPSSLGGPLRRSYWFGWKRSLCPKWDTTNGARCMHTDVMTWNYLKSGLCDCANPSSI